MAFLRLTGKCQMDVKWLAKCQRIVKYLSVRCRFLALSMARTGLKYRE